MESERRGKGEKTWERKECGKTDKLRVREGRVREREREKGEGEMGRKDEMDKLDKEKDECYEKGKVEDKQQQKRRRIETYIPTK